MLDCPPGYNFNVWARASDDFYRIDGMKDYKRVAMFGRGHTSYQPREQVRQNHPKRNPFIKHWRWRRWQ